MALYGSEALGIEKENINRDELVLKNIYPQYIDFKKIDNQDLQDCKIDYVAEINKSYLCKETKRCGKVTPISLHVDIKSSKKGETRFLFFLELAVRFKNGNIILGDFTRLASEYHRLIRHDFVLIDDEVAVIINCHKAYEVLNKINTDLTTNNKFKELIQFDYNQRNINDKLCDKKNLRVIFNPNQLEKAKGMNNYKDVIHLHKEIADLLEAKVIFHGIS